MTKGSFCANIETAFPRTPRCRMGSSPDLECGTRMVLQSAAHAAFLPYGAARRSEREHSAFPEASHPVGEHAAGACTLLANSPGGPRSSAPTWPPLPRRLERHNRPARPRCHSTLRLTLARSWPARLNLAGWLSGSAVASILDALKLLGSSASLQASRRSRGARSSTARGRVMLLFGATRRVGVTMYL